MQSFHEWAAATRMMEAKPWLILGKGPSFARRAEHDLHAFWTLGLNHVCREQPVTIAHAIDLDVVDACGDAIERHAERLVMPWRPQVPAPQGAGLERV